MENYEKIIDNCLQSHPKLTVPDGYFDTLADRIIAKVADRCSMNAVTPTKPLLKIMRAFVATAACTVIIVIGIAALSPDKSKSSVATMSNAMSTSSSAIDQAADCMMIDNDQIYAMLAE